MGLIKSANTPASLSPFSMADIEKQARAILVRARQKAEQLLIDAQRNADEIRRQAQAEGLASGYDQGIVKGMEDGGKLGHDAALSEHRTQFTTLLTALTAVVSEIDAHRQELETRGLREVIQLAIAIADRVTKRQGRLDPEVCIANVAEAMQLVVSSVDIRVALNPLQIHVLNEAMPRLRLRWPELKHIELVEDETLSPGGCRIFTRHGRIDADLEGQLERIAAELVPAPSGAAANAEPGAGSGP